MIGWLKLKLVHLYRYSSAFPHTRTRLTIPYVCTLVPVGHTVRPGLVWFDTHLPVYLSTPILPLCYVVFFLFFLFLFFVFFVFFCRSILIMLSWGRQGAISLDF